MAELTEIQVEGVPMPLCFSAPKGDGPHPAMVIMFHRDGFDDFTRKIADDLAAEGFFAVAPDVYHWPPVAATPRENPLPKDPEIIKDVSATLDWLAARGDIDGDRLGIIGHCMGGRMAFLGASTHPQFKVCLPHYSGNMFKPWSDDGPTPFELLKDLDGKVMGFFGNDDGNPSPEDVDKLDAELTRLGIEHTFHRYDGAGHAFQNFCAPDRYRPEQTKDSWAKAVKFLQGTIGS